MADHSYVRTEMLPDQPAPLGETGILLWLKTNMFSGIANSVVSIFTIVVVVFLGVEIVNWGYQPSWGLGSVRACFDDPNVTGACWGVIPERFNQLMYGFYPRDQQWRINLSLILMIVAIAPVLFNKVPRKMVYFSMLYPFLAFWLIWGDSIWGPIAAMAGFAIAWGVMRVLNPIAGSIAGITLGVVAALGWWLFLAIPAAVFVNGILGIELEIVKSRDIGGLALSVIIGISGIALSFPIGVILALGRQSDMFIVKVLCVGYIEFIRGVPLITLLFVASVLLNYFLPPGTSFDLLLRVVIVVTLFSAAYLAEVVRGGLAALPTGQYEAADALGLDYWKSMRLIIMPQALKISIPGIVSNFIGLFKDTTLVSIIGLLDPVGLINAIRGTAEWKGILWELYIFLALMFWIFTFAMSRYSMYLERKLKTGH